MVERRLQSYELGRMLGEGGMACVYLARDVRLGRDVAVKVLSDQLAQRQGFRERFLREARLAAALDHPNIVPIYDFGDESALFLVMPFVSGGSLQHLVREGPMDPARVATYGAQIADALDYAHQRNVVHRDVKPANILIHADGRLMLSDFGLAKILSTGAPVAKRNRPDAGTPEYMAPEQIEGQSDPRSDIYGLGVVLYLLLTGKLPFTGPTPGAVMEEHLTRLAEPPRRINPAVTPAMDAVVLRALAKHPDDRYQTATELGAALLAAVVAGDAEPLPFLADGGLQSSLPPWLSVPSLPAIHSAPSSVTHKTAAPPWAATEPASAPRNAQRPTNTTHTFPSVQDQSALQSALMPPPPQGAYPVYPSHLPSPTHASIPVSQASFSPSTMERGISSALSGAEADEQGWSRPLDRSELPTAFLPNSPRMGGSLAGSGAPSGVTSGVTSGVISGVSAASAVPLRPTLPPASVTTPESAPTADPTPEEGGLRVWPMLLLLLALLLIAVGTLVGWVATHQVLPH